MSGVLPTGFVPKTQPQIFNEEVTEAQSLIKSDLDLSPVAPTGQVLGIAAEKPAEVWEVGQVAYNATNRGAAEGALLDNIGGMTGCPRNPATFSSVWASCSFSAAGTYAAGALVGFVDGLSSQQASNTAAIVVPSPHPANGNPVSISNQYVTGSSYAPATLFQAPVIGPNFAQALIAANAGNVGNVGAFSGMVPVSGWTSLVDLSAPTIGGDVETDTAYRLRQAADLGAQGSCNLAAIEVDIIEALAAAPSPVIATCKVYENTTDYIDSNGLLPHSYQVVVFDGLNPNTSQDDPIIGQQIWNNKPPGIRPYGTTSVVVVDSQGVQRTVTFTRPTQQTLYMVVNVLIASTADPSQVQAAIVLACFSASQGQPFVAYGQTVAPLPGAATTLLPGVDVVPGAFDGLAQAQAGVVDVTDVFVAFTPNPTQSNVLRTPRGSVAVMTSVQVNCTVFQP